MSETPFTPADLPRGLTLGQKLVWLAIAICCFAAGFDAFEKSKG